MQIYQSSWETKDDINEDEEIVSQLQDILSLKVLIDVIEMTDIVKLQPLHRAKGTVGVGRRLISFILFLSFVFYFRVKWMKPGFSK